MFRVRPLLCVAEDAGRRIKGFATLLDVPDLGFSYLDYLSAAPAAANRPRGGTTVTGRGDARRHGRRRPAFFPSSGLSSALRWLSIQGGGRQP
jgi:hypothetical protein